MKILLLLFLLLNSFISISWATDFTADINCQGAWLFTEGSGATVADSSQNSKSGNFEDDVLPGWLGSGPNFNVSGSAADAVDFNGESYINCGTDATLDISTGTIVFWVQLVSQPGATDWGFVCKDNSGSNTGDASVCMGYLSTDNKANFFMVGSGDSIFSDAALSATTWYHVAVSFGTGGMIMYVNGVAQADTDAGTLGMDNASASLILGALRAGTWQADVYMSETAVFDRTLSLAEINAIYDYGLAGAAEPPAGGALPVGYGIIIINE